MAVQRGRRRRLGRPGRIDNVVASSEQWSSCPCLTTADPAIVAILRGVKPDEIVDIAAALVEAGIEAIEVPLNSPDPLVTIGKLCAAFGDKALCGAGTVLSPEGRRPGGRRRRQADRHAQHRRLGDLHAVAWA
jgi:hypothetical protein